METNFGLKGAETVFMLETRRFPVELVFIGLDG